MKLDSKKSKEQSRPKVRAFQSKLSAYFGVQKKTQAKKGQEVIGKGEIFFFLTKILVKNSSLLGEVFLINFAIFGDLVAEFFFNYES